MLNLAPTRRRLLSRQVTLADGTTLTVQARVPTYNRGETPAIVHVDELAYAPIEDLGYAPDTTPSVMPTIPADNCDL